MAHVTAPAVPTTSAQLTSGAGMPLLGFGTWQLHGSTAYEATAAALAAGYRHLDTATMYGNETEVGAARRDSGVARDEVFVTTKLPPDRADRAAETLAASLAQLGVEAVDLWLVHWPPADSVAVWRAFVQARDDGLAHDIGVSNYGLDELDALTEATGVTPAVNQIRWSPKLFDADVLAGHRERGVVLEGYSALKGGTLDDPTITAIADRLERTPAQVIIRWHLQQGTVVIPRSSDPVRIASNADVDGFTLTEQDVAALDALGG